MNNVKPLVSNAANEGQVAQAAEKQRLGRDLELEDFKWVLSTPQGRRMVARYIGFCGVWKQSFTGNSETFFNEGKRVVGLKLLEDLNDSDPSAYMKMMNETK